MLETLNDKQKEAVLALESPLLIMAGAGSGKTRVLTHKIAYLIKEKGYHPKQVLAVTFTNKAAKEMLRRVHELIVDIDAPVDGLWINTFHAICARLLRRDCERLGYQRNFIIYDTQDQRSIIKQILVELDINSKQYTPDSILYAINHAKNELISPEKFEQTAADFYQRLIAKVYYRYQDQLKKNNVMDFDDLLYNTVRLLQEFPDITQHYQQQFRYILVDEYQDTNLAQYLILHLLAREHHHICVVGDADQNIYSWRGANIQNILNFEKDFPGSQTILLEQNYRSTQVILEQANQLIQHNANRKEKNLWTDNSEGEKPHHFIAHNENDEARHIAETIESCVERGFSRKDICILYRTNTQSRVIEEMFIQRSIPYRIFGGQKFYERKEVKDIVAYLRLIFNPNDNEALNRIINEPPRKIGKVTLAKLQETASQKDMPIFWTLCSADISDNSRAKSYLEQFYEMIIAMRTQWEEQQIPLAEMIEIILKDTGYEAMLLEHKTEESTNRIENIRELMTIAKERGDESLEYFLENCTLVTDMDRSNSDEDRVAMMTMHNAKGLEYSAVIIAGFEENLLPHYRSLEDANSLEEERRLCYVAMTRAEKELYFTSAINRSMAGSTYHNNLSTFFYELDPSLLEVETSYKLSPINELVKQLKEKGYSITKNLPPENAIRSAFVIGNPDKGKVYKPNLEQCFDFDTGQEVMSPSFGTGIILKTFGKGTDVTLQIQFNKEVKVIMPKYTALQKV